MLGSPPRSKIAPRTPGWFAGNPPQPKSTGWGLVSQGDTQLRTIVTVALPCANGATALVALTFTVLGKGTLPGAVYSPVALMVPTVALPPAAPFTFQITD